MKSILLSFLMLLVIYPSAVRAQTNSFNVSPAEHLLTAQPGTTAPAVISLQNKTNKPVTVSVAAIDFEPGPFGGDKPNFLPLGNPKYGIANWFADSNLSKNLTIPANQTISYKADFRVPYSAAERTYYGAVIFTSADGQHLQEALVYITVGSPATALVIKDISFGESQNALHRYGLFSVTLANVSEGLSAPNLSLKISGAQGSQVSVLQPTETNRILPESERLYTFAPTNELPEELLTVTVSAVDQNGQTADKSIQLDRSVQTVQNTTGPNTKTKKAPWFIAFISTLAILVGIAAVQLYRHRKSLLHIQIKKRTIKL